MNLNKTLIAFFATYVFIANCDAQKLPDQQEKPVWAAHPVKVDGKIEAGDFAAFDKSTRLKYSLSNDARNLYLVIQMEDVNKLLLGGITLTVNTAGKKKEKDAAEVTFPVITRQNRGQGQRGQGRFGQQGGQGATVDSAAVLERRKQQIAQFKEIKVMGIESITDTLISIYNEYGIKAAVGVDIKGVCSYEMAIPLNLLKIDPDKPKEFAFKVQLNGRPGNGTVMIRSGNGFGGGGGSGPRGNFDPMMNEPTFFWGKYLPAKQ